MRDPGNEPHREKEFDGPVWQHPYFAYILWTGVLFVGLLIIGTVAWKSGIIPDRGVSR